MGHGPTGLQAVRARPSVPLPRGDTGLRLQVRQRLVDTRKRMEDILAGGAPADDEVWYETTEALAEPLLACYWSLWECGSGIVAEGARPAAAGLVYRYYIK